MNDSLQVASYLEYEEDDLYECEACGGMYPEEDLTEYCTYYGNQEQPPEYAAICVECDEAATAAAEAWEEARGEWAQEYARYQYEELK